MRLPRGLEFASCVLAVLGAAAAAFAVYRLDLFYETQSFGGGPASISLGLTLYRMGTFGGGVSALYSIATWAISVSAIVCLLGGLAVVGAFRFKRGERLGAIAVGACGVLVLVLFLIVGSGPGLGINQPGVSYPRGPAMWVGISGAGLLLVGSALGFTAPRQNRVSV